MKDRKNHFVLFVMAATLWAYQSSPGFSEEYIQLAGIFDIRTDFSDGAHSLDDIIRMAEKRGIDVLFINDHARVALEYGLWPFRNILKRRVEEPSITKAGAEKYLNMIQSAQIRHPEMIIVAGAEISPFYYWKGHYFRKNLTVCDWERHLLVVGLEKPEDYEKLPIIHNNFSTRYVFSSGSVSFFLLLFPFLISLFMLTKKGIVRYSGVVVLVLSLLFLINDHPFKSSPFDQYHGPQGIAPYQLSIDDVNSRGAVAFWNHPETKSGLGKLGSVFKETLPYPRVLVESKNYTGFAALYGDTTTVTEPGNVWDQVLNEYCRSQREKPVWAISTADFHREGAAGEKLGNFATLFLVKNKTKKDVWDALRKGRMYAHRGDVELPPLTLEEFSILDTVTSQKGLMGEEIIADTYPRIRIRVSAPWSEHSTGLRLIRSGDLIKTYSFQSLLDVELEDEYLEAGRRIYYRLDVTDKKGRTLVSNPIFVKFKGQRI